MQTIYAMHQNHSDNIEKEEKFLFNSIDNMQDLYLVTVSLLLEIRKKEEEFLDLSSKKYLATREEKNPNLKFVNNKVLRLLEESNSLSIALTDRKINDWHIHEEYVKIFTNEIKQSDFYKKYMINRTNDFQEDKDFIINLFTEILAPNTKLYEYLEDHKLTWIDDIPLINTFIAKQLRAIKNEDDLFFVPKLFNDIEDREFVSQLFRKTTLNEAALAKEFAEKTPNWEVERIAEIDTIILKMAICELLKFPSIPVKVTINEYLEIAKEYSTPKSSIFINGILDNLVKEFNTNGKLKKTGRGLM
ncbi:transcription antitermination factor NusB [Flavobacterium oreochromis]|uniref:Transcription antitermination factor NusB n=1 Tax=Flavobacterium columnare TaxID=996 RepID=A0A246G8I6_9FLAO|nr:transcription antitermination factor NusB [Flavobacterium oreochromis]OWP75231.1 transcription antitermination factor NusB [Flavobacterium oreochromis]QYS85773.1 transcription antitermination factor NusB [Flavobacterium oreochromis]